MRPSFVHLFLTAALLAGADCARIEHPRAGAAADPEGRDTLFQFSTIDAILQGVYEGEFPCMRLKQHGDLGIGTFDSLDGEMAMVDGEVYQVRSDGKVIPASDLSTPFATVTFFDTDRQAALKAVESLDHLQKMLDPLLTNPNVFYAIRLEGTFGYVKTRSVPRQARPYPPLTEVTKNQPTFEFQDVRGTLVGFWCPAYVKGVNVPGYHLHFLSADRTRGGHLLECRIKEGTVRVDASRAFTMQLPAGNNFGKADLTKDRQGELDKVE